MRPSPPSRQRTSQAAARPFEHFVLVQPTPFQPTKTADADKRIVFHTLYQELIDCAFHSS
jgi:hypothetical protein